MPSLWNVWVACGGGLNPTLPYPTHSILFYTTLPTPPLPTLPQFCSISSYTDLQYTTIHYLTLPHLPYPTLSHPTLSYLALSYFMPIYPNVRLLKMIFFNLLQPSLLYNKQNWVQGWHNSKMADLLNWPKFHLMKLVSFRAMQGYIC